MAVATTIPRYNKNQMIIVENHEMRLIDHLKELRISRKITKKRFQTLLSKMIIGILKLNVAEKMEMITDN